MSSSNSTIDPITVLQKVREMRKAQQEYFKYRYKSKLELCKKLEDEVDAMLKQIVPVGQQELFQ